ncbi:MAG: MmgE/PrpD family protein [Dehalococcoidia bacterium]
MDAIYDFVKHFIRTRYEDIPDEAIQAAKIEVIDSIATALGGSTKSGIAELVDMVKEFGGAEQSTVIAYGLKCPAPNAAQVNGTMIHALDYDDGHQGALVHIGCVAVPTCFAISERMGKRSGKEVLTALALGHDFESRLSLASRPGSSLASSGWHPTAIYGYFGAAAMSGILMNFDEEKMINALGIAYHQSAGNGQCVNDGAMTKRMGPGFAARGGITAAIMAEKGITGARNILEGEHGVFNVYHGGDYDRDILLGDLGKRFEGANLGFKPYPCCGFTHSFIDAVLAMKAKYNIQAEDVKEITAYAGEHSYNLSIPPEVKRAPRNIIDSQFSVPWSIATALVKGKVSPEHFTEQSIKDKKVLETAAKVTGVLEPSMNRHGVGPGRLVVKMNDGTEYDEWIEHCLGSLERPMKFDDCVTKFRDCAVSSIKPLSNDTIEKVIDLVVQLDQLDDATEIIRMVG